MLKQRRHRAPARRQAQPAAGPAVRRSPLATCRAAHRTQAHKCMERLSSEHAVARSPQASFLQSSARRDHSCVQTVGFEVSDFDADHTTKHASTRQLDGKTHRARCSQERWVGWKHTHHGRSACIVCTAAGTPCWYPRCAGDASLSLLLRGLFLLLPALLTRRVVHCSLQSPCASK